MSAFVCKVCLGETGPKVLYRYDMGLGCPRWGVS